MNFGINTLDSGSQSRSIFYSANGLKQFGPLTLLQGQNLKEGCPLGKITKGGVSAAAKAGGNTGNGVLTLDASTPKLAGCQVGVYQVRCIGGTKLAAKTDVTGAGKGALTLADPAVGADVKFGQYRITCIEPATNAGTFKVEDPDGIEIGIATAGQAFDSTHIKFTIADGGTDFVAGDVALVTVSQSVASNSGTFQVTDPNGVVLGTYVVGTAAFASQIKFTIADGTTDFAVGDGFDITIAAGSGKYKIYDSAAVDGSEAIAGILGCDVNATAADEKTFMYVGGEFNLNALKEASGISSLTAGLYLYNNIIIKEEA